MDGEPVVTLYVRKKASAYLTKAIPAAAQKAGDEEAVGKVADAMYTAVSASALTAMLGAFPQALKAVLFCCRLQHQYVRCGAKQCVPMASS